jgi:DNA invertase Pin-like site-specific DNA recombinase
MTKAVAYLRTSSAANVGTDKDSDKRQRAAIEAYAKANKIEIVTEFYDAAVSGADPLDSRPGFAALLERVAGNGVTVILVETASRFARDLMIQEVGYQRFQELGLTLIAVDSPTSFIDDTPTANLIRQVLGAVSELDKAMTVSKLKAARDRKKSEGFKVEGRKSAAEVHGPDVVKEAKRLRRASPLTGERRSYRKIAELLAEQGIKAASGKPLSPEVVRRMIAG